MLGAERGTVGTVGLAWPKKVKCRVVYCSPLARLSPSLAAPRLIFSRSHHQFWHHLLFLLSAVVVCSPDCYTYATCTSSSTCVFGILFCHSQRRWSLQENITRSAPPIALARLSVARAPPLSFHRPRETVARGFPNLIPTASFFSLLLSLCIYTRSYLLCLLTYPLARLLACLLVRLFVLLAEGGGDMDHDNDSDRGDAQQLLHAPASRHARVTRARRSCTHTLPSTGGKMDRPLVFAPVQQVVEGRNQLYVPTSSLSLSYLSILVHVGW